MKLNEITEVGFYCSPDDKKRNYIYEVIENTDKEWLKESPEQKFLIDEWVFDYIDKDDRYNYGCAGNLIAIVNAQDIEVVKITDKKYKVHGEVGEFLIEDKPTYKEKLEMLKEQMEQDIERYKLDAKLDNGFCVDDFICDIKDYLRIINI